MKLEEKKEIKVLLEKYCEQRGSQNRASKDLKGVSSATVSQLLNDKWDLITEDMFRKIGAQVGWRTGEWALVDTAFKVQFTQLLHDAKNDSLVVAALAYAGNGKSKTAAVFTETEKNVFLISCKDFWRPKGFLNTLLHAMGSDGAGLSIDELMDEIIRRLLKMEKPLIIFDEVDKLADSVFYFFISFYNELEDRCGMVLTCTDYLERRILKGLRLKRKGFQEIYSRLGRKFVALPCIEKHDVHTICLANGLTNDTSIRNVTDDACHSGFENGYDLRRVKRAIYREKKRISNPYRAN